MKTKLSFSHRPFSIFALSILLAFPATAQDYGGGGFAPTPLSGDMGSSVSAAPLPIPSASGGSYQANVEMRLSELENQMRSMRGQLEEKDFQINQLKTQLEKALSDMDMRLSQPAAGGAPSADMPISPTSSSSIPPQPDNSSSLDMSGNPNAPAPSNAPTQQNLGTMNQAPGGASIAPASGDVAAQYEAAYAKLKAADYVGAQNDFDRFLKANPNHQLASNATYWYGETFYAQKKYTEAARIFAESYKKYPKGPKAADSLLKLGMSLGGSGKTKEACVSLKQLKKQYPTGNGTLLNKADQEMAKLSCS